MLDSEATYRVVEVVDDHALVEALDVPGLPPGHQVRLTLASVAAMERLSSAEDAAMARPSHVARSAFPRPA